MKKHIRKIKQFFIKMIATYNEIYVFIDIPFYYWLSTRIEGKAKYIIYALIAIEGYRYWKHIFKNYIHKKHFFAAVKNNNVLAIYGGIGSGKSTLANYIINRNFPKCNQYHNYKNPGSKIFTHDHLFLREKIEENSGVIIDEAGRMYDSFKYDVKFNDERLAIVTYNKFFRQFYGNNSMCIYIDQAESNLNTALYRTVYYVIQCKSITPMMTGIIPYMIAGAINSIILSIKRNRYIKSKNSELHKLKLEKSIEKEKERVIRKDARSIKSNFNIFTMQAFELLDFQRIGEYGEHYSINKDDKSLIVMLPSIMVFGNHDTRIFKSYNPGEQKTQLYWGENTKIDEEYMRKNFNLMEKTIARIDEEDIKKIKFIKE